MQMYRLLNYISNEQGTSIGEDDSLKDERG